MREEARKGGENAPEVRANVGEGLLARVVLVLLGLAQHHFHAIRDERVLEVSLDHAL